MNDKMLKFFRRIIFNTPLREYAFYKFNFNFTADQLCFLCQCIEQVREVNGSIAEIGCAIGNTTVFLNNYMDAEKIEKKYFAIDTFSGFVSEDVEYEVSKRNKDPLLFDGFQCNMKKWFDYTMNLTSVHRVVSIQADVNKYDLTTLGSICFALLDVDLYRPIKKCLKELYSVLTPNGIIVVDDCDSKNNRFDGSAQAYNEFVNEINHPIQIIHHTLGIVRKQ